MKRIFLFLCLMWVVCPSFAALSSSGSWGNLTWSYNKSTKVFVLSGFGRMKKGTTQSSYPWHADVQYFKSIIVEEGVLSIEEDAFEGAYSLESLQLPNSLTYLGKSCFEHNALLEVNIPCGVDTIEEEAFARCANLVTVRFLGDSISYIGQDAFFICTSLKNIYLPNRIGYLKYMAFDMLDSIEEIVIPEGLHGYSCPLLFRCPKLKKIIWNAIDAQTEYGLPLTVSSNSDYIDTLLTTFEFGNRVKKIPHGLCRSFSKLKTVILPNSLRVIEGYAFYKSGLREIYIPDSVEEIGAEAFSNTNIKEINLPENLKSIDTQLWSDSCRIIKINSIDLRIPPHRTIFSNVDSVILGPKVTRIPSSIIEGSTIRSITIPESVRYIDKNAFTGVQLRKFRFPAKMTKLEDFALSNTKIDSLILGTVDTISSYSFISCSELKYVKYDSIGYIGDYVFFGNPISYVETKSSMPAKLGTYPWNMVTTTTPALIVPNCGCIEAYETAWAPYFNTFISKTGDCNGSSEESIEEMTVNEETGVKFIKNGLLYIKRLGKTYNSQGYVVKLDE